MKVLKNTQANDGKVIVIVGEGNYFDATYEGQCSIQVEAAKLVAAKPELAAIAAKNGFTIKEKAQSSLYWHVNQVVYNKLFSK